MNSIKTFCSSPRFLWPFYWGISWFHPKRGWCKHFIHTFEFVNLSPVKVLSELFREEIDVDQCYLSFGLQLYSEDTLYVMNSMLVKDEEPW